MGAGNLCFCICDYSNATSPGLWQVKLALSYAYRETTLTHVEAAYMENRLRPDDALLLLSTDRGSIWCAINLFMFEADLVVYVGGSLLKLLV